MPEGRAIVRPPILTWHAYERWCERGPWSGSYSEVVAHLMTPVRCRVILMGASRIVLFEDGVDLRIQGGDVVTVTALPASRRSRPRSAQPAEARP